MSKKKINKFSLSYYSLTAQVIIINLITATIGLLFIYFFNVYLLNSNKNIDNLINNINNQISDIANYIENNAIIKVPQFNEDTGELLFSFEPQLDPYTSQLFVESKYLKQLNNIKIFNTDLVKYVDTENLYINEDVIEINVNEFQKENNFYSQYRKIYYNFYNNLQDKFNKEKLKNIIEPKKNEISLIIETIKNKKSLFRIYTEENGGLFANAIYPLIKNNNIYGVVLIESPLIENDTSYANISFIIWNLFLIIILSMFIISIFFMRSIIHPIKILSSLAKLEQSKYKLPLNDLQYPIRNDEIGGLSYNIKNMSSQLKQRINELENFAADVAHELKNPLASLKSSSELLADNKIQLKNRKLLFSNINQDLDKMNRLISDISNYTRTQAEVEKQNFDEFDLIEFINNLESTFSQNKKSIKINFDLNDSVLFIQTNLDKLAQVFINLLENAISFSPPNSKILIKQLRQNDKVIIFVVDQGKGIKKSLKNKIFDRFYTDRKVPTHQHTGLGLSISKKIIENFGGSLELSIAKIDGYKGACFKLEMPIKPL